MSVRRGGISPQQGLDLVGDAVPVPVGPRGVHHGHVRKTRGRPVRRSVRRLIESNPAVGLQFLQRTAENLRESEESRLQAATLPLRVRLAHLLLVFKDRFGTVEAMYGPPPGYDMKDWR